VLDVSQPTPIAPRLTTLGVSGLLVTSPYGVDFLPFRGVWGKNIDPPQLLRARDIGTDSKPEGGWAGGRFIALPVRSSHALVLPERETSVANGRADWVVLLAPVAKRIDRMDKPDSGEITV